MTLALRAGVTEAHNAHTTVCSSLGEHTKDCVLRYRHSAYTYTVHDIVCLTSGYSRHTMQRLLVCISAHYPKNTEHYRVGTSEMSFVLFSASRCQCHLLNLRTSI